MILDYLLAGIVLGLSAGLSPGPLQVLVVSETLLRGRNEGIKVALAPLFTDLPIIAATVYLVDALLNWQNFLFLIGGIYLIYLGVENVRLNFHASVRQRASSAWFKGFAANITNPHPYVFWLSVGSPLVVRGLGEGILSPAAFLLGFYSCLVGSKIATALIVSGARNFFETKRYFYLVRFLGIVLIIMGLFLVTEANA